MSIVPQTDASEALSRMQVQQQLAVKHRMSYFERLALQIMMICGCRSHAKKRGNIGDELSCGKAAPRGPKGSTIHSTRGCAFGATLACSCMIRVRRDARPKAAATSKQIVAMQSPVAGRNIAGQGKQLSMLFSLESGKCNTYSACSHWHLPSCRFLRHGRYLQLR